MYPFILLAAVKSSTKVLTLKLVANNNFTHYQLNAGETRLNIIIKIQWYTACLLIGCELYTSYALLVIRF